MKKISAFILIAVLFSSGERTKADAAADFAAKQRAWADLGHLHKADLDFFFDQIQYVQGHWQFQFSRNVQDQHFLWRMRSHEQDTTGVCESGHVLNLLKSTSLEIKRNDIVLFFEPIGDANFRVRMTLHSDCSFAPEPVILEATRLFPRDNGYGLAYVSE